MDSVNSIKRTYGNNVNRKRSYTKVILLVAVVLIVSIALFAFGIYASAENIRQDAAHESRLLTEEGASAATNVDISDALRTSTVNKVIDDKSMPSYSVSQVMQLDVSRPSGVTAEELKLVTKGGLVGLEESFVKAEQDYGVNCLFVMAIASLESANGTICFRPNNMFGFGSSGFSSKAECIDVVSRALANNYLSPSGSLYSGKTISAVNKRYASSSTWDDKVARNMANYYSVISSAHNAALDKLK